MPTYTTDPLRTEMLRCERRGTDLFRIDPEDTPAMWPLTVARPTPLRKGKPLQPAALLPFWDSLPSVPIRP
jgi:hypothetical protein